MKWNVPADARRSLPSGMGSIREDFMAGAPLWVRERGQGARIFPVSVGGQGSDWEPSKRETRGVTTPKVARFTGMAKRSGENKTFKNFARPFDGVHVGL